MNRLSILTLFALAVLLPLAAQAQVTVLLSETTDAFPINPNADLGLPVLIDRVVRQPSISTNGRYIGLEVELLADNAEDDSAVLIDLQTGSQTVLAREGTTLLAGEPVGFLGDVVRVNNSGQAAFHAGNSATVFWNGRALFRLIAEGDAAPTGAPRSQYGDSFSQTQLTNAGVVGGEYDSNGTGTASTFSDDFVAVGSSVLVAGDTAPLPGYVVQDATRTGLMEDFFDFDLSPSGNNWMVEIRFDDDSALDTALAVNGTVVAQEGVTTHTTPGGVSLTYERTTDADINDSGDWITQSSSDNSIDYTLVNNVVVFAEGELAPGESGPDGITFSSMSGVCINSNGDYISLWNTSDGNSIFILNEDTIILTEGVTLNLDYNGDGVLEDLVVDNFATQAFSLADDGTMAAIFTFDDLDGVAVGSALVTFNINDPPVGATTLLGDVNLDTVVNFLDIAPFIAILSAGGFQREADIDGDGVVGFLDITPFIAILRGG